MGMGGPGRWSCTGVGMGGHLHTSPAFPTTSVCYFVLPTSGAQGRPARCPGRGSRASQGEASPRLRPTWSPQKPPTLAPTPQASVDTSQQPAGSPGPLPNSWGAACELGGVCLGEGQRFWQLPVGRRKGAPNRWPPWASGTSFPGEKRPLE